MVRTRFAPSPTGYLHIGGVRTALFNWLFARQHGGQFILRIDDTDRQRNVASALQPILDGFRWLGLDWDEGPEVGGPHAPYYQSERSQRHQQAVRQLLDSGHAYYDYATAEEIAAERQTAESEKRSFTYSRRWMAQTAEQREQWASEGRQAVVRLKMHREGSCRFTDLVRGDVEFQWAREQDHVIQRADGSCLYHLASVVDDADFEITHVVRAVEHLSNTPRQIFIAQSLGFPLPQFAHLPYVAEPGSSTKLSKRKLAKYLKHREFKQLYDHGRAVAERLDLSTELDTFNPVIVDFYRDVGYLPEALVNYLLLLGWSLDDKTETFTRQQMIDAFSLERVNKAPASFDPQKLWAFEQRAWLAAPLERRVDLCWCCLLRAGWTKQQDAAQQRDQVSRLIEAAGDRIKVAGDLLDYHEFFCNADQLSYDAKAVAKRLGKPESRDLLRSFRDVLATLEPFDAESTERALKHFVEQHQIKIGQVIHALRVAVTGKSVGIGMFDSLALLRRADVLARIDRALQLSDVESE